MTEEQITQYEYCKEYLEYLNVLKKSNIIKPQKHGCGTGQPSIEFVLEEIHVDLYKAIFAAIEEAEAKVKQKLEDI